jgi:dihydroxyacetone kinase-like protein
MKKLINRPEDVVKESLAGLATAHADLVRVHFDPDFIVRADAPVASKVGIVSGGGSGHRARSRSGAGRHPRYRGK